MEGANASDNSHWHSILNSYLGYWKTALVGLVTFLVIRFIISIRRLPPGPIPLPFLGNLLLFRGTKKPRDIFSSIQKRYGDVYTIWFGNVPFVIVSNWEMIKTALLERKYEFDGRYQIFIMKLIVEDGGKDIAMVDPSPDWEVLRKLGHTAIRKYTPTENVALLVHRVINENTSDIVQNSQGSTINAKDFLSLMVYNITAFSAFMSRYDKNDQTYLKLKKIDDEVRQVIASGFIGDFIPILRPLFYNQERKLRNGMRENQAYVTNLFVEHKKSFQTGVIRDFTDAVLAAKAEAIKDNSESAKYMTDKNLTKVVGDLFNAGTDTTTTTMLWVLLHLAHYPNIQDKIFQEVQDNIGERMVVQEDVKNCPYTSAVISEVLRLKIPAPLGLPHKTICDTKLGGHYIPKNTGVLFYHASININEEYWKDAETFCPERFLDSDGNYTATRFANYTPFGLGRRSCIGEKLARAYLFLITVGLIQKFHFKLSDQFKNVTLEPKANPGLNEPEKYELVLTPRI